MRLNSRDVSFTQGQTILEVARENGVRIPTLCHYKRSEPIGSCRICLVEVTGAATLLPACATAANPDMEVQTDTERVWQARRSILTMLVQDGHHDCPICDAAGECPLQDLAYEYGVSGPELPQAEAGKKAEYATPLIRYWPERCILCHRCVIACRETKAIGAIQIQGLGNAGRVVPADPESCRACGECLLVCPTGALTENLSRYKGRPWLVERVQTICPDCACGCQLELNVLNNRIIGVSTTEGLGFNQGSLCVRGRFGYEYINSDNRLTRPLIRQNGQLREAGWDEALDLVARKLDTIRHESGPEAVCGLTMGRATLEEQYLFQKWLRVGLGTNRIHTVRLDRSSGLRASEPGWLASSPVSSVYEAKTILVAGSQLTAEAPIFANAVVEAVRFKQARLILIDPDPGPMADLADIQLKPRGEDLSKVLRSLAFVAGNELGLSWQAEGAEEAGPGFEDQENSPDRVAGVTGLEAEDIREAARAFCLASTGVAFYGQGISNAEDQDDAVQALYRLAGLSGHLSGPGNGLIPLRQVNNELGSLLAGCHPELLPGFQPVGDEIGRQKLIDLWQCGQLPSQPGPEFQETLAGLANRRVKAVFLHDERPRTTEDAPRLPAELFAGLDFCVVQDLFLSEAGRAADVVLPGAAMAEKSGLVINGERKVQLANAARYAAGSARTGLATFCSLLERLGGESCQELEGLLREIRAAIPQLAGVSHSRLRSGPVTWPCPDEGHTGRPFLGSPRLQDLR
jgi:formate dehydrogenase alpha subunit